MHAADNTPTHTYTYNARKWRLSVPAMEEPHDLPSTVETFGEKISTKACSGKEIAGLLKRGK